MKRLMMVTSALLLASTLLAPTAARADRDHDRGRDRDRMPRRTLVVVAPGHPIHRPLPSVLFRRPSVVVRVAPVRFMPLVVWRPYVIERPSAQRLVWQDAETLSRREDWTETVFDSDQRGDRLFLQVVSGRVQFDFAEVVFENGECQVVDFAKWSHGPGLYGLLDFADGRRVDHVRLIARAQSGEARVALLMQK